MLFHVLTHIKANKLIAKVVGELFSHFCFSNAGWTSEKKGANRLTVTTKANAIHFDR